MRDLTSRARQSSRPDAERARIGLSLVALRGEIEALVSDALGEPLSPCGRDALASLPADMRRHLADLLDVPLLPEFYPLLELKAAEYIEQGRAFDELAAEFGFLDGIHLGEVEPRGALVLTHNGSLVQLSAPGAAGRAHARRYVYQNIYGGLVPSEGTLVLAAPVRLMQRMQSSAMDTSAVRKLRLAVHAAPWHREREAFTRISTTLVSMRPRKTLWGAAPDWVPSADTRAAQSARADRLGASTRIELAALVARLADPNLPGPDAVHDARILGLCIHLQRLRVEHGEPGHRLVDIDAFETDRGERCRVVRKRTAANVILDRPGKETVQIADVTTGAQLVVRGAPIALLDGAGDLAAVLGDVVRIAVLRS